MKAEIVNVTPQLAAEWLRSNLNNRPLRRTVVEGLKAAFRRGEYVQTHQGIAFSESGELLDGQHRLTAIAEMRDASFPILVTRDVPIEAFRAMDIGVKRTAADALRIDDTRLVEVARLIAWICSGKRGSVTPTMLIPIIHDIEPDHSALVAFCPTCVKTWSAAPVRLAAIMAIRSGSNADYVHSVYRSLVRADFDLMPPVARALYRAHVNGIARAANTLDMLARSISAFSMHKASNTKIYIRDTTEAADRVRLLFSHLVQEEKQSGEADKKKAAPKAAKSVLPLHSIKASRAA